MSKRGKVYNKIFNNEEWDQVNKKNKLMIQDYLEEYRQQQKKESTLKQYFNDLRIVMIYILRELDNMSITDLSRKDFRRFSLYLKDELKVSNARANRLMSSVRSVLTYIEDDDDYDYEMNVALKVKGLPKEAVRTNEDDFFLSFDQIMTLREELIKRDRLQDAVLLMLSFDSGARRGEIYQVLKEGLDKGNRTNIVVGKRGKEFSLVYLDDTKDLIQDYLEQREEDEIESLWVTGKGDTKRPITYSTLYDRMVGMSDLLSEIEGKQINFFNHSLRHSRVQVLLDGEDTRITDENGNPVKFPLEKIQKLVNHSDISTTQGYAKDNTDDVVDEMFGFK